MGKIITEFFKVLRSYTIEERVISLIALIIVVIILAKDITILVNPQASLAASGVYTEAVINDKPTIINPVYSDLAQANRDISSLVFTGLMKYDLDLKNFVDDLGTLTISEDQKEYLFKLRENVWWHDGEAFDADDVVFTYGLVIQDPAFQNPILKANFEGVKVKKVDQYQVKFTIDQPNSFFITNLNVGILPQHVLTDVPVANMMSNDFSWKPIGTGPYQVLDSLELLDDGRQRVTLFKNEQFYGKKPQINQIRFQIYPDQESLNNEKSSINIVSKVNEGNTNIISDSRFEIMNYTLPQYNAVFFNLTDPVLEEKKVRLALQKAVDKDELVGMLENKIRVDTPLMELNQDVWHFQHNVEEANGSLFDAGYKFVKDEEGNLIEDEPYRKNSDDEILELKLLVRGNGQGTTQAAEIEKVSKYLISKWSEIGVKVDLEVKYDAEFSAALEAKDYQMVLAGQSMGYNLDTYSFWHSSEAKELGLNFSMYSSFAVDQQIEKIRSTFDQEEKTERVENLAVILQDDVPAIFLYRPQYVLATDNKVEGLRLENMVYPSDRFARVSEWCIGDKCA